MTLIAGRMRSRFGSFYGPGGSISLGVGAVYTGVRFPLFDEESRVFDTVEGAVYVLTHECDVDQTNDRDFNDRVLVCPLHPFENFAELYVQAAGESKFIDLVTKIADGDVYRAILFPPFGPDIPFGAVLYLNEITNTAVSEFKRDPARQIAVLSSEAQQGIDWKISNHLLRPKAEQLPRYS